MKKLLLITLLLGCFFQLASAQTKTSKKKIIYEYKKYEKFDFGDMAIEGSTGAIGDLSVSPRYQVKFSNELPKKPNFNKELIDSVDNLL